MDLVTLDFETAYGDDYTLSKLTTEAYVRDIRFETILCGFKINQEKTFWVQAHDVARTLKDIDLTKRAAVMHHAHFDAFILNFHYDVRPKLIIDTLGMARALHGANGQLALAKLAIRYGIGRKGEEVILAKGKRLKDFSSYELNRYGSYCCNDVDLTYELAQRMTGKFSRAELEINDRVIRMFTEPVLLLDSALLGKFRDWIRAEKHTLMLRAGVQQADLMSNPKFAQCLLDIGIDPPRKISPTTKQLTWAFAKTDPGMQALQEHPDELVQVLVEARLKNKTTLAEKGAQRLIGMSARGPATVYYKYSGAGTHRLSGGDKYNWQSQQRGSDLRNSVQAPIGFKVVASDSSNIEARMLDWLAGQEDMVEVYRKADAKLGPDMYCTMGESIYERPINKKDDPDERQMGKRVKLGFGFGMGAEKFAVSVRREAKTKEGKPLVLTPEFATHVYRVYRNKHPQVVKLWKRCEDALGLIAKKQYGIGVDYRGIVTTCEDGLLMPGGLRILYPELEYKAQLDGNGEPIRDNRGKIRGEWTFWNGKLREHIYGPKVTENIIQSLSRIVVFTQCLATEKECNAGLRPDAKITRWVLSNHDEGGFVAPDFYAPYVLSALTRHMRTPLWWCPDLPLNCEAGFHQRYGLAKT